MVSDFIFYLHNLQTKNRSQWYIDLVYLRKAIDSSYQVRYHTAL